MKISRETFRSPRVIFVLYIAAASVLIMAFRYFFPGVEPPLPVFSKDWRLVQGAISLLTLFPALAFSALVAPFGLAAYEDYHTSFSPLFFQRLFAPLVTAIGSAAVYALIFFLLLPLARDAEEDMRFRGELYRLAKERAQVHGSADEWLEVSQFIGICDGVWPNSPELAALRARTDIQLEAMRFAAEQERAAARAELAAARRGAAVSSLPGQRQPLDAADAIAMGEAAFADRRFYDAHWFATLAGRIAKSGSPEAVSSRRLAARAWNQIEAQTPGRLQTRLHELYLLKQSGYQAMVSGDWIRGYYIFQELTVFTPDDPDVQNFLAVCEKGTKESSFFIDEIEISLGDILTGAIFSLPAGSGGQGRAVLRIASLSTAPDYGYGIGIEYLRFDAESRLTHRLEAPYAKLLPFTLDGRHQVLVMMRALNRHDESLRWEPQWIAAETEDRSSGGAQITLDVSYETFLLLSRIRQRISNLQLGELFSASEIIGAVGYVPQVFQAEILNRLGSALFFLPMAVIAIIIGWRFRAKTHPRYLFFPLLPLLPIVFNVITHLYRGVLNTLGIWLILAMGFSSALVVFAIILAVSLVLSLIFLAAQHG